MALGALIWASLTLRSLDDNKSLWGPAILLAVKIIRKGIDEVTQFIQEAHSAFISDFGS